MGAILISKSVIAPDTALPLFSDIFPGVPDPRPSEPLFADSLVRSVPTDMASLNNWYTLRLGLPVFMTSAGTESVGSAAGYSGYQSGIANVDIRAVLDRSVISESNYIGFVLRAGGTLGWNNCIRIYMSTNTVQAVRAAASPPVVIGQAPLPAGVTGPKDVRVTALGDDFHVYFDGNLVLSFTESFNQSATIHGIIGDVGGETHFRDLEIRPYTG